MNVTTPCPHGCGGEIEMDATFYVDEPDTNVGASWEIESVSPTCAGCPLTGAALDAVAAAKEAAMNDDPWAWVPEGDAREDW